MDQKNKDKIKLLTVNVNQKKIRKTKFKILNLKTLFHIKIKNQKIKRNSV